MWSSAPPTDDGLVNLSSPTLANPSLDLGHNSIPILCLTDALDHQGYGGVERRVVHVSGEDSANKIKMLSLPPPLVRPSVAMATTSNDAPHLQAQWSERGPTAARARPFGYPSASGGGVGLSQAPARPSEGLERGLT